MAVFTKRNLKKLVSHLGIVFFALAFYMIYRQLSRYSVSDIYNAMIEIPTHQVWMSLLMCVFGYVALAAYDFLALVYVQKKVSFFRTLMAGIIGFAISNNAGHAIVSGGAIRYRLYTRWRIRAEYIVKMVIFSGFTYFWGCLALLVLGYVLTPSDFLGAESLSHGMVLTITFLSAGILLAYLLLVVFYDKTIVFKGTQLTMPSLKLAVAQIVLGAVDLIIAGLVLYYCIYHVLPIPFVHFLGIFLLAQVLGVFSQVPGGLGVFEGLFLFAMPETVDRAEIMGALVAFRIIYYLIPLIASGIVLLSYEYYIRRRHNKIVAERKKQDAALSGQP